MANEFLQLYEKLSRLTEASESAIKEIIHDIIFRVADDGDSFDAAQTLANNSSLTPCNFYHNVSVQNVIDFLVALNRFMPDSFRLTSSSTSLIPTAFKIPALAEFYDQTSELNRRIIAAILRQCFNISISDGLYSLQYLYNAGKQEDILAEHLERNDDASNSGGDYHWLIGKEKETNDLVSTAPDFKFTDSDGRKWLVDAKIKGATQNSNFIYSSNSAKEAEFLVIYKINDLNTAASGIWSLAINAKKTATNEPSSNQSTQQVDASNGYIDFITLTEIEPAAFKAGTELLKIIQGLPPIKTLLKLSA